MVSFNSGGEALTALLGGHVARLDRQPARIHGPSEQRQRCGRSACSAIRVSPDLADVPTMKEQRHRDAELPDVARRRRSEGRSGRRPPAIGKA